MLCVLMRWELLMSDLDAAVEAAAKESWSQLTGDHGRKWADLPGATRHALHSQARRLIEAAAPHIAAQVLQDAADDFAVIPHLYEGGVTSWLRDRAAAIDE